MYINTLSNKEKYTMKKSIFTMAELVIILSVCAVFAALFIPAVSHADAQSKNAACLDNQKLCQRAAAAYADDNGGILFLKARDNQTYTLLWGMVRGSNVETPSMKAKAYIDNFVPALCPELNIVPPSRTSPGANGITGHYAVVYRAMKIKGGSAPAKVESLFCDTRNRSAYYMHGKRPSSAVMDTNLLSKPDAAALFAEAWSISLKKGWYTYSFADKSSMLNMRHDDSTNMVFADGHAASLDLNHFAELKKNKFILLGNTTGRIYNSSTAQVVEY